MIGQIVDSQSLSKAVVAILSAFFPSMNHIFITGYMGRYERQDLPTDRLHAPQSNPNQKVPPRVSGIVLWLFLVIQIVIYPTMAVYAERLIHSANSHSRKFSQRPTQMKVERMRLRSEGLPKFILQPYARDYSLTKRP